MTRMFGTALIALALAACGGGNDASESDGGENAGGAPSGGTSSSQAGIQPLTRVDPGVGTGYFEDPYPIHSLASATGSVLPTFSGTTKQILSCAGHVAPGCFVPAPVSVDSQSLRAQVEQAGSMVNNLQNLNICQDAAGAWQMAVTARLSRPGVPNWSVILHASPTSPGPRVPTGWQVDALLVGDFAKSIPDNYDGKYFEDAGTLYLTYNKQLVAGEDGIVAQSMATAAKPDGSAPVPLLGPERANGGYNSELAYGLDQSSNIKLIETGNVFKIGGKYVMTYSAGTYNRLSYKSGLAWSDSFVPRNGQYYKRVEKADTAGVWGQRNHAEVQYLLQSQAAQWSNYVAAQVLAPGVPAIISDPDGGYLLTFAGYDPSDAPINASGLYQGSHRRPYYVRLKLQIPNGRTVAGTSPQDLANWLIPVLAD